jgi:hypothetical protein
MTLYQGCGFPWPCSILPRFRTTLTAFAITRTQAPIPKVLTYLKYLLVSRIKHVKFGANRCIRSRAMRKHTHIHTHKLQFHI